MSTFLIIKPDFEKNHESEKGLDTIRQHAAGSASESGIKCSRAKELSQVLMERHPLLEGKLDL